MSARRARLQAIADPVRLTAAGDVEPNILDAYRRCGFYLFEGVVGSERVGLRRFCAEGPTTFRAAPRCAVFERNVFGHPYHRAQVLDRPARGSRPDSFKRIGDPPGIGHFDGKPSSRVALTSIGRSWAIQWPESAICSAVPQPHADSYAPIRVRPTRWYSRWRNAGDCVLGRGRRLTLDHRQRSITSRLGAIEPAGSKNWEIGQRPVISRLPVG